MCTIYIPWEMTGIHDTCVARSFARCVAPCERPCIHCEPVRRVVCMGANDLPSVAGPFAGAFAGSESPTAFESVACIRMGGHLQVQKGGSQGGLRGGSQGRLHNRSDFLNGHHVLNMRRTSTLRRMQGHSHLPNPGRWFAVSFAM